MPSDPARRSRDAVSGTQVPPLAIEKAAEALCAWPMVKVDDREHGTATHMAMSALGAAAPAMRWPLEQEIERLRDDLAVLKARPDTAAPLLGLLGERDRLRAALEDIHDGLLPHRHRLSSEQAREAFYTAQEALDRG